MMATFDNPTTKRREIWRDQDLIVCMSAKMDHQLIEHICSVIGVPEDLVPEDNFVPGAVRGYWGAIDLSSF